MSEVRFTVERYSAERSGEWDEFVRSSRNGTFLLQRGYMDYHSDRFADCSWMVCKSGRLIALLPASTDGANVLHSHGGLTYGGWILPTAHLDGADLLEIFETAIECWRQAGITAVDYKPVPFIYSGQPSQEDEYALFRLGAMLTERNLSAAINLQIPHSLNKQQKRHLAKALQNEMTIEETGDIEGFMSMLTDCLAERHDTAPVHTAAEMRLLKSRFPDNIRFHVVKTDGKMQAGVCVYDTGRVAHAQYIATTPEGREKNLLTPLFVELINEIYSGAAYFDFGISNEDHGRYLNTGLLRQKYSYGATGVTYSRYWLDLGKR